VDPTIDGIAHAARTAVDTARGMTKIISPTSDFAPAPVLRGEWATPVEIDPFAISPDEHVKVLGAYSDAARHVENCSLDILESIWTREARVFASSEGTLLTQQTMRSSLTLSVSAGHALRVNGVSLPVVGMEPGSGGFERLLEPVLQERIKVTAEEAARLVSIPEAEANVGRYEAVLDGTIVGEVLGATLAQALDLGRALGLNADGDGTSFLAPTEQVLGQSLFSPQLTVVADRSVPHFGAAKWDDEGVATESFPVIQRGCVVDYFTTRSNVSALAAWYAKRGQPLRSNGSAVSWAVTTSPVSAASQLVMTSGTTGMSLDALTRQLSNGIIARNIRRWQSASTDQQLSGGAVYPQSLFEVKKGQITRRLLSGVLQFRTKSFWRSVTACGDASTVQSRTHLDWRGETHSRATQPVWAPAVLVPNMDVIQIGRAL